MYAIAVGVAAWFATGALAIRGVTRSLITGDVAGMTLLALLAGIILTTKSAEARRRAASEDPGRGLVWAVVLVASTFAMFSATFVLWQGKDAKGGESLLLVILALTTAVVSWLLTHASFTLRYAHLFYRGGVDDEGGIEFPTEKGEKPVDPDDLDFAYFAFTIGMCFQVSDSEISDRGIRRTALAHAVLSFAYNTGIIALVLSVVTNRVA